MRLRWSIVLAVILAISACDSSPIAPDDPNDDTPDPIGEVSTEGGTLTTTDGGVTLDFPEGAISGKTPITVEPVAEPPQAAGLIPGTTYDFGPDGTTFSTPVTLTIRYDASKLPEGTVESSLALHKLNGTTWNRIPGSSANPEDGTVSGLVSSFSIYGILSLGPPATLAAHAGGEQAAVVGQKVETAPAVVVRNEAGEGLPGVVVTFAITSGGGTLTGAVDTTDAEGIATVGSWTLGKELGENTLTATVEGLDPVVFKAQATAGAPSGLALYAGRGQSVPAGRTVPTPPAVRVTGAHGLPVAGATVNFSVTAGEGTVTGEQATTDSAGIATVGSWTLGKKPGLNSLAAAVEGLTDPLIVSATAVDPCVWIEPYLLGQEVKGTLDELDCLDSQETRVDRYLLEVTEQVNLELKMTAADYTPVIHIKDLAGTTLVAQFAASPGFTRATLAPGSYVIAAQARGEDAFGAYEMSVSRANHNVDTCDAAANIFVTPNTRMGGVLTSGTCVEDFDANYRYRNYFVWLEEGRTYTWTMDAKAGAELYLYRSTGESVQFQASAEAGTTTMRITADRTGFYRFGPSARVNTSFNIELKLDEERLSACEISLVYDLGTWTRGWLGGTDCANQSGRLYDYYWLYLAEQSELELSASTSDFTPAVNIFDAEGQVVAAQFVATPGFGRAILAPGWHRLMVAGDAPGGFYWFRADRSNHDLDLCGNTDPSARVWLGTGVTANGSITAGNCLHPKGADWRFDAYYVYLQAGRTYTLGMSSTTGAEGILALFDPDNQMISEVPFPDGDASQATINVTPEASGFHVVAASGPIGSNYQLLVSSPSAAKTAPAAAAPRFGTIRPNATVLDTGSPAGVFAAPVRRGPELRRGGSGGGQTVPQDLRYLLH